MNPMQIISLIDEYNSDPRKFTDAESEVIAELAKAMNRNFKRESKPIRKAIFELGDMATFGLLPDSYRPVARGEKAFGETDLDSIASTIGMVGGLGAGLLGASKAVSFGAGALKGRASDALKAVRNRMSGASTAEDSARSIGSRIAESGFAQGASQMAGSLGRGAAGLGIGMGRAGANYARMGRFKAASNLSKNLNIPMDVAEKYLNYSAVGGGSLLGLNYLLGD